MTHSLAEYMREKKRESCPVCQLDEDVQRQLLEAKEKGIPRRLQVQWLKDEIGVDIKGTTLTAHRSGGHDEQL